MKDKEYWKNYYGRVHHNEPSPFAKFLVHNYLDVVAQDTVVDMCCGDGRDTEFLHSFCGQAIGVDCSIKPSGKADYVQSESNDYIKLNLRPNLLYCRFGIHAMEPGNQRNLVYWGAKYIALEARSDKGVVPDSTHYRRPINAKELFDQLYFAGYRMLYFRESEDLAPYGTENPMIVRAIGVYAYE